VTSAPAFAAADWGTTRLRLWLVDGAGEVVAERRSDEGLLAAQPDRFAGILERQLAGMGAPADLPVIVCGMAGARQGWVEAPYVTVPASLDEVFAGAVRVKGVARDVRIVPGLAQRDADAPDVMRGEETQLAGAASVLAGGSHLVCMPGTHSKWVAVERGTVARFQTYMTGELFSVLSSHSILGLSLGKEEHAVSADDPAFRRWCADALAGTAGLEPLLFRIRAATLLHGLGPRDAAAALSGLLVGAEIAAALKSFGRNRGEVVLVASGAMRSLYETALGMADLTVDAIDADTAVRAGLVRAARHHGMAVGADA
jgi:2-dehydro-3-deoxygalactonokinase